MNRRVTLYAINRPRTTDGTKTIEHICDEKLGSSQQSAAMDILIIASSPTNTVALGGSCSSYRAYIRILLHGRQFLP